jgi:benzoate membrane transport protein
MAVLLALQLGMPLMQSTLHQPTAPTWNNFLKNLLDFPQSISLSGVMAGFLLVLINYTGPILLVLQAAEVGNLTPQQTTSWVWAAVVGNGIGTILFSLLFRQPITFPHSTAGVALLVTSIAYFPYEEVIGAYILSAVAISLLGISGWFGRVMSLIPQGVILAVLGGVLLRFGLGIFNGLDDHAYNPIIILAMVITYILLRRVRFSAPSLGVMLVGLLASGALGMLQLEAVPLTLAVPTLTLPRFSLDATVGIALPLFALAMSSQYAPGQTVLLANGYNSPINRILGLTGLGSIGLAFFGGHGNCLGALTAALVVSPDAQPDPNKRYASAVMGGVWHIVFGLLGATMIGLFAIFPKVVVATVAGLALSGTIANSLGNALEKPEGRDAAILAFLCTAGDFSLFTIGAPFWGLLVGSLVHALLTSNRSTK